jgi:hypothetical protein
MATAMFASPDSPCTRVVIAVNGRIEHRDRGHDCAGGILFEINLESFDLGRSPITNQG